MGSGAVCYRRRYAPHIATNGTFEYTTYTVPVMDVCGELSNSQLPEDAGTARQRSEANEYREWVAAWARTDRSVR
ncbi:hypothetical protein PI124_g18987 [Phytophthora idaei]|nr:hypothetical protein PI125_g19872 [Phytophthora idaei]KAG3235991.1 hypothetical protein PI124_g18987 [Phytophthora idaei]